MRNEYHQRGDYAIRMLDTAEYLMAHLPEDPEKAPYFGTAVASCLRQAVMEIFKAGKDNSGPWRKISRRVTNAKQNYEKAESSNKHELLQHLIGAISDLEKFHDEVETSHEYRLKTDLTARLGPDLPAGYKYLLTEYDSLIEGLVGLVHQKPKERQNIDTVHERYHKTLVTLHEIIVLNVHMGRIIQVAKLPSPKGEDVTFLHEIKLNASDLDCFASHMTSSKWFEVMDADLLKPPQEDTPWIMEFILRYLKYDHRRAFICLIENNLDCWTADEAGLNRVGYLGFRLGEDGIPILAHALTKGRHLEQLRFHAIHACILPNRPNPKILDLTDCLLDAEATLDVRHAVRMLSEKLVQWIDPASAEKIVHILADKTQSSLNPRNRNYFKNMRSIADAKSSQRTSVILASALIRALQSACRQGAPAQSLVRLLDPMPEWIRPRLVAQVYASTNDVESSALVDFVVSGCRNRPPHYEDEQVLERLRRNCDMKSLVTQMAQSIGETPEPEEIEGTLNGSLPGDKCRRILWASMMAFCRIDIPGWERHRQVLRTHYERIKDGQTSNPRYSESPIPQEEFDSKDPYDVLVMIRAHMAKTANSPEQTHMREIGQQLEDSTKRNPEKWTVNPVRITDFLKHPTYVKHYFRGLASAERLPASSSNQLIRAIWFARSNLRPADPQSSSSPDGALWNYAGNEGIGLIAAIATNGLPLSKESLQYAWSMIHEAVIDRTLQSPDGIEDIIDSAINRPCTYALQALLNLVEYASNRNKTIPEATLSVLTDALYLTGRDGEEHRAIIAKDIRIIRLFLPCWFEQNEPALFGNEAPDDWGQRSLEMHLMGGQFDEYVLQRYRDGVLEAVGRNKENALYGALLGMFLGVNGYGQKCLAESLYLLGSKYVSMAGELSATLVNKSYTDHIETGLAFWRQVLDLSPGPEALAGYGRWALVSDLDQEKWELLMRCTCEQAGGKVSGTEHVALRIKQTSKVTDSGLKILTLIIDPSPDEVKRLVTDLALDVLCRSKEELGSLESWPRLRLKLLDHGRSEAY